MGLAALYLLHDEVERASGLPLRGAKDQYGNPYDVPLILARRDVRHRRRS